MKNSSPQPKHYEEFLAIKSGLKTCLGNEIQVKKESLLPPPNKLCRSPATGGVSPVGSRSGDQVSNKDNREGRQKSRTWKLLAKCLSMFLCQKRMAGQRLKQREQGGGGRGQLMDGVAQQGSEVRRARSELIGHSAYSLSASPLQLGLERKAWG